LWSLLVAVAVAVLGSPCSLSGQDRNPAPLPAAADRAEISGLEKYYRERVQRNPQDQVALEGMAILEVRRAAYAGAIASYRRALELAPRDYDARVGLARALAYSGQYDAAQSAFQAILKEHPEDTDGLEGLAQVYLWSGRPIAALPIFQGLAKRYPASPEYALELARVEMRLARYAETRQTLTTFLTAEPRNREAQLQFASLDLLEGHPADALRRFNHLLIEDPTDVEALRGNARLAYYRGDLNYAHELVANLAQDDPRDVPTLLLLAQIERALHNRRKATALQARAETLDARNDEARELRASLRNDSRPTFHTSASWAREIGSSGAPSAEDLRSFGYETTWGFSTLPRSDSYFSMYYLPSNSPSGGIGGAVGPSEFLYRQTTYWGPQLTLRGGLGLARFGPGELAGIPTQDAPIHSAGIRPVGFINLSCAARKKLRADFTEARSALAYTPTAVRLGLEETRTTAGLNYHFDARTELSLESFSTNLSTIPYDHVLTENESVEFTLRSPLPWGEGGPRPALSPAGADQVRGHEPSQPGASRGPSNFESPAAIVAVIHEADHKTGRGGSLTFDRQMLRRHGVALDLGYSGLAYGFRGAPQQPYLGLFTPGFYQRQYLTTRVLGRLRGALGYDFSGGMGVQQVELGGSVRPALLLNPALTLRTSPRAQLSLGYTYYDSSQSLGALRGNAVRLSTDWKF
jgi:tetratricopeptide (TPR) repeat protein